MRQIAFLAAGAAIAAIAAIAALAWFLTFGNSGDPAIDLPQAGAPGGFVNSR